jgi:hypothetical protein
MTRSARTSRNPTHSDHSWTFAVGGALAILAALAAGAVGCSGSGKAPPPVPAAKVERAGQHPRLVLSAEAAGRLGIATARVRPVGAGGGRVEIPFAALLYDPHGRAFTFVSSAPRTYERRRLRVAGIAGDRVILSRGPAPGARVVVTGGDELLGAEQGVQAQ